MKFILFFLTFLAISFIGTLELFQGKNPLVILVEAYPSIYYIAIGAFILLAIFLQISFHNDGSAQRANKIVPRFFDPIGFYK